MPRQYRVNDETGELETRELTQEQLEGWQINYMLRLLQSGKYVRVHRLAMILDGQELHRGFTLDHLCENKCCWNTLHLEKVTYAVNKQREVSRRRR